MPDAFQSSGQRTSVRGNTLQQKHSSSEASSMMNEENQVVSTFASSALAIEQQLNHHQYRNQQQQQHHQGYHLHQQRSSRSFIRMLPVSSTSTSFDTSNQIPPSPPSSPDESPNGRIESDYSQSLQSFEGASKDDEEHLRQVLTQLTMQGKAAAVADQLPDTPNATPLTLSPAEALLRPQPHSNAREFVRQIFPSMIPIGMKGKEQAQRGRYIIEDAGLDLINRLDNRGAAILIDTKPAYVSATPSASSSFNNHRSNSYTQSFSSTRMSRRSSGSTAASFNERSPRRTLLTQINTSQVSDANRLRESILEILDCATERLNVDAIMFVLNRSEMLQEEFRATVHGLCYVGATIVGRRSKDGGEAAVDDESGGSGSDESIYAPRSVGQDLVLLSVDV